MSKFLLFGLLWALLGNPFLAILVLVVILYFLDRRFIGLTPSFIKPLRRRTAIRRLRQQVLMNPSDVPGKHELARLLIERKRYEEAKSILMPLQDALENSAEFWDDLGACLVHLDKPEVAEAAINNALSINPRVKYGAPYLRLASLYAKTDPQKAIKQLDEFRAIQTSSCEAYYKLAQIYKQLGRLDDEKQALAECVAVYRMLPKYKRRQERKWAVLARLRKV